MLYKRLAGRAFFNECATVNKAFDDDDDDDDDDDEFLSVLRRLLTEGLDEVVSTISLLVISEFIELHIPAFVSYSMFLGLSFG